MKISDKNISAICQDINIYFGGGSIRLLQSIENSNVLIVTDRGIIDCGLINQILEKIPKGNGVKIFDQVMPDPSLDVVSKIIVEIEHFKPHVLIAIGGGSPIDAAKGAIHVLKNGKEPFNACFIAIPTTSGTGSEVTDFTVLTDLDTKKKHVVVDKSVLPNIAVLDSDLVSNLPKSIIAFTGMDTMAHSLEAYVAKGSNDYSEAMSEKAGELVFQNLVKSYFKENNLAREKMHHASTLAGLAFNSSGLGIIHSLAHQLGSKLHLPHGLAISLVMVEALKFNAKNEFIMSKYAKYAKKAGVANTFEGVRGSFLSLIDAIEEIRTKLALPKSIRECRIDVEYDFNTLKYTMARDAMLDVCTPQNYVGVNRDDMLTIFETVY